MGIAQALNVPRGFAPLVMLSILRGGLRSFFVAGILRGSDGTLWDFVGFLMAVSAH